MADIDVSKPAEPPKPVHIGGESIADRILPHIKKIMIGMIIIAVILTAFYGFRWWRHRGHERETEKLATVLAVAQRRVQPAMGMPPDPHNPGFTTAKERADAVLESIAKTDATATGPAFRANLLVDAGKLDEAIAEYRKCERAKGLDGVVCREGLGIALEAKASAEKEPAARQKGLEEALAAFAAMQPDEAGPRRVYALYHQGRIQQILGKHEEAKQLFAKAKSATPPKELADMVEKRLASLGGS